ncbi:hypothetical protein U9M48_015928 [Paspalum notatum var. saurae]|uniref:Trehalose 6-phosphate phosphatase n=1 Tax=Paspalum notatum var. saurae TaxID=547442 RepID=A0AAQ3T7J8_PASNO
MTKHATAFAAEDALVSAPAQPGRRFTSYPPPRARGGGCRAAAGHAADPGAAGVAARMSTAGSWLDRTVPRDDDDDWMAKHPSALGGFESVLAAAKGKQVVMFLDYDGTLSPIVKDPDSAVMSEEVSRVRLRSRACSVCSLMPTKYQATHMRDAVRGVAEHFPTAIVSGRCRDKVFNFVKLAELYYAGSHGMDIKGPTAQSKHTKAKAEAVLCQPASEFLPVIDEVGNHHRCLNLRAAHTTRSCLETPVAVPCVSTPLCRCRRARHRHRQPPPGFRFRRRDVLRFVSPALQVYRALTARTASVPGARVENNKFCLSVHFRCVQEEKWRGLEDQVRSVLKEYPDLRLTRGRKVLEIRPSIKWDKGNALQFLLESLGFADSNNVFPIYIGDDRTDEDAFKVLRSMGQGIGILVSKIPKETSASYSLREPSEVKEFLHRLVKSKQSKQRD